jgi:hypothetical protein
MSKVDEYRGLAAKFRRDAEAAALPNQRESNLAAAEKWEILASELERTERQLGKGRTEWFL